MSLIPKFLRSRTTGDAPESDQSAARQTAGARGAELTDRAANPGVGGGTVTPPAIAARQPADGENGSDQPSRSWYRREVDSPFHQHDFRTRAEFLKSPKAPRILISDHAYRRMCLIVELAPKEVGWLGTAERMPSGNFYIDEIFVPEQEVTGTETDPTDEGQFKIMNELAEMGEEGMQKIEKLRFWGHSHVHMMTSPSGTDENTPLNYQRLGLPWFIRGIFNKLGRAEFTVYLFEEGYRFLDVPWVAVDSLTGENLTTERTRQSPVLFGSADRDRRELAQERQGERRDGKPVGTTDDGAPKFDAPQPVVPPVKLHPKLVLGEAERKQVAAELRAKLKERSFGGFFGGWGGRNNDATTQDFSSPPADRKE
jgi:hypothetical protein